MTVCSTNADYHKRIYTLSYHDASLGIVELLKYICGVLIVFKLHSQKNSESAKTNLFRKKIVIENCSICLGIMGFF